MSVQLTDKKLKNAYSTLSHQWDTDIIPQLERYISIPCKSVHFDPDWKANGYIDAAMQLITAWCEKQPINGMTLNLIEEAGRTPLLYIDIAGQCDNTLLLYGHMDKQPEMTGWDADKGPWKPVLQDGKLYGRGGADDGYAVFATLTAIKTLQDNDIPHGRCVVLIEASEESGSCDLPFYLEQLKTKIGTPDLIICLDSSCGNYEQLWSTTSLRGLISGTLQIDTLAHGMHSGNGGAVPTVFDILRQLLDRVSDSVTHEIRIDALNVAIPEQRYEQAEQTALLLKESILDNYQFSGNTEPLTKDYAELLLNRTWRASLSVIGIDGVPTTEAGGNVMLPHLAVALSLRIPPTCESDAAMDTLKKILETDPPHQATVSFTPKQSATGWNAPELASWLSQANDRASQLFYDKPAAYIGEGGTIPFMGMLGAMFPSAQFLVAGLVGPGSNIHGPNEALHIDMAKRLTGAIASVIASHYEEFSK